MAKKTERRSKGRETVRPVFTPAAVFYGLVMGFVFAAVIALVLGSLLFFVHGMELRIQLLASLVGLGGACLAGTAAAARAKSMGWLHGALTGLGFILVSLLIGMMWVSDAPVAAGVAVYRLAWGFTLGAVGGMMGINF